MNPRALPLPCLLFIFVFTAFRAHALEAVPDKLVVLTFDDSVASHHSVVRPLLKRYGFGATFFITEGFSFRTNKQDYMTWEQIAELHKDGFEIGNHTRDHLSVSVRTLPQLREQMEAINARCRSMAFQSQSASAIRAMPSCRARCRFSQNSASGSRGAAGRPSIRTTGAAGSLTNRARTIRC